ncbi:hypothetical protein FIBSPDRAFT_975394 [Athelia psychrophila]|uniref:Uncharacterized protein n=1 Tax=Athelia psychrophila TaxID=1759441 RepID=A0A166FB19_9AGAM|nr:hypothetical protein FIBSPDRAFT_975394 [Fibularhizoctonia sp. CBS 109695]
MPAVGSDSGSNHKASKGEERSVRNVIHQEQAAQVRIKWDLATIVKSLSLQNVHSNRGECSGHDGIRKELFEMMRLTGTDRGLPALEVTAQREQPPHRVSDEGDLCDTYEDSGSSQMPANESVINPEQKYMTLHGVPKGLELIALLPNAIAILGAV